MTKDDDYTVPVGPGFPSSSSPMPFPANTGSRVNDLLTEAGDNIDEAIAVLYQMLTRAVRDGEDHVEGRINDALNLCEQIGGLTVLGRSLAGYVT